MDAIVINQEAAPILESAITEDIETFDDTEMEKLDKWADDVKSSIEIELKELDREIKARKTEAKKILKLEEKVKAQRQIKEMEKNGMNYGRIFIRRRTRLT